MRHQLGISIISLTIAMSVFAEPHKLGVDSAEISSFMPITDNSFLSDSRVAKSLGWIKNCNGDNLCGGCYSESSIIVNDSPVAAFCDIPMNVTASNPAFFTETGVSVVQGDVKLIQPGREIMADRVTFFRDNKTGKIHKSLLVGHVNFRESGKLIVSEQGSLDFFNKIYILHNGAYRLLTDTPTGLSNVWGRAKHAISSMVGVLQLKQATYTTCQPDNAVWHLRGDEVELNRNTGRGDITHATLYFKKLPVFYLPYFNFPIDKRRQSGFLTPTPTYSKDSGFSVDIPYYFNLAPNYDITITPQIFTNRGLFFGSSFRYLTVTSSGSVNINHILHDSAFIKFRDSKGDAKASSGYHYNSIKALKESKNSRGLLNLRNDSIFNDNWKSSLSVNYATDDYFLQDFSNIAATVDNDQLLNRADISYTDYHFDFLGRLQVFQTLHPITHKGIQDQYKRLPQINFSGDFPGGLGNLDYGFDSEIVNFMHRDDFYETKSMPITGGSRFNITPCISAPISWLSGYITPRIGLQTTGYNIHDQLDQSAPNSFIRLYPLFSIDSGIVFRRDIEFFHKGYTQTLEPRLFYLLIPNVNQNKIPKFDTYLPAFDFNQLFRINRFSGIDRVGDANQIAVGVTTRFLDEYGQEKFNAGLGQIVSMHKHLVDLDNNVDASFSLDPLKHQIFSPLVGKMQYTIIPKVNITFNTAWDPSYHHLNTFDANLQYIDGSDRVANFWYRYVIRSDQDPTTEKTIDFSRAGFSTDWRVWQRWHVIGGLSYNIGCKHAQNYLYGLEYSSCCWAMRIVHSRNFIGVDIDNKKNYESKIYLQFLLKGVNNFDYGGLEGLLASQVSGYNGKLH
jgi:LPS-assembly protein